MAIAVSKRKSRPTKYSVAEVNESGSCQILLYNFLCRIPPAIFFLLLIFLWSCSTTIISGNIVHVCVSSRKLNDHYCLSAGTHPHFKIPIPTINYSSSVSDVGIRVLSNVQEDRMSVFENGIGKQKHFQEKEINSSSTKEANASHDFEKIAYNVAKEPDSSFLEEKFAAVEEEQLEQAVPIIRNPNAERQNTIDGIDQVINVQDNDFEKIANVSKDSESGFKEEKFATVEEEQQQEAVPIISSPNSEQLNTTDEIKQVVNVQDDDAGYRKFEKGSKEEKEIAVLSVQELLKVQRSWQTNVNYDKWCDGKGIFVYDLPSKFNEDLIHQCNSMIPWTDLCKYFTNDAFGEPIAKLGKGWYNTHQYALEPIFHSRVLNHSCRVYDPDEAKLFYVPFYGGLDILRWHFKNVSHDVKDSLGIELVKWLESQPTWTHNSGKDHVFVLGKISWDFRRLDNSDSAWGTRFLELDQLQNPVKLLIERQPWQVNDIGIPHPTNFHPHSDEDIIAWQTKIIQSNRRSLVSFAGGARPGSQDNIRSILIDQCTSSDNDKCRFLDCKSSACDQPETVVELFLESEFCMQPPGDSPTRKSVFDSLISGCIPVLFDPFTAYYQYAWHLPEEHDKYSVFIDQEEVRQMKVNVVERLMKISKEERDNMRRYIVYELMPRLAYGDIGSKFDRFQDAFTLTLNNLLERTSRIKLSVQEAS